MKTRSLLWATSLALAMAVQGFGQPAVIQFSSAGHSVSETGGVATITVEITWGDPFNVYTMDYVASDGTALAGLDYIHLNGTLSFEWPETTKSFTIPIHDDTLWEGDETVLLTLRNPRDEPFGFGDEMLGSVSNAVLTIQDDDKVELNWFERHSAPNLRNLNGIVFGAGLFVAVGDEGRILTSPDGESWTGRTSGTTNLLRSILYAAGMFVAVGNHGTVATSPDGTNWSSRPGTPEVSLRGVAHHEGQFVAVGSSSDHDHGGAPQGVAWTSNDGLEWVQQRIGCCYVQFNAVTFGASRFVAVGSYEQGSIWTSEDGIDWTPRQGGEQLRGLTDVTFGNNTFVAVGPCTCDALPQQCGPWVSSNGIDWASFERQAERLAFGGGVFLAMGGCNRPISIPHWYLSLNGKEWFENAGWDGPDIAANGKRPALAYGSGTFIAVGESEAIWQSSPFPRVKILTEKVRIEIDGTIRVPVEGQLPYRIALKYGSSSSSRREQAPVRHDLRTKTGLCKSSKITSRQPITDTIGHCPGEDV